MNVIFTDVDGVLNNDKTRVHVKGYRGIDLDKVKLLKEIVDETDSKVVISSTWRLHKDDNDAFWKHLVKNFKEAGVEIYDVTPEIGWDRRAAEIGEWLKDKEVEHIIILDDEDFYWRSNLQKYWIDTFSTGLIPGAYDGLTEDYVKYIKEHFDDYKKE